MCFGTDTFYTDTSACYFISEGRLSYHLSGDVIILCVG